MINISPMALPVADSLAWIGIKQSMERARALSHLDLTPEHIADIRLASKKMGGAKRRAFMAKMSKAYCHGSPRSAERVFGWGRNAVKTGLEEMSTGNVHVGLQRVHCGAKRWEARHLWEAAILYRLAEGHSQQDPTFNSTLAYTRLTAKAALAALKEGAGICDEYLPSLNCMALILNRMGFRLRPVLKAKPLKKIPETDAIFANVKEKDRAARDPGKNIIRASMDCKATVHTGQLCRGGLSRGRENKKAHDHDFEKTGSYTPCGILNENSSQVYINIGCSSKTSDFMADTIIAWWNSIPLVERKKNTGILLKMDNGPESSGSRTQFLKRMVEFVDSIGKPVRLLYYPPYHSKYNPIERCWGILEQHWNGALLTDLTVMTEWAKTMTWKGIHPIIETSKIVYEKGITLLKSAMREIEKRLKRDSDLPKYDIYIEPIVPS